MMLERLAARVGQGLQGLVWLSLLTTLANCQATQAPENSLPAMSVPKAAAARESSTSQTLKPSFVNATTEAGLSYAGPTFGAAAADFDEDGWPDLAVSRHGRIQVWRNNRDGTFAHYGIASGRIDTHGISWLDVDQDGWLDLYVTLGANRGLGQGANRVYLNQRGERFRLAEELPAVLADPQGRGRCSVVQDIDGDGRLDVLVLNAPTPGRESRLALRRNLSGQGGKRPWRKSFVDATRSANFAKFQAECATILPMDMTSDPILFAYGGGRDSGRAFRWDKQGRLQDVTSELGLPVQKGVVYRIVGGDYDNDGDLDILTVRGFGLPSTVDFFQGRMVFRLVPQTLKKAYSLRVPLDAVTKARFLVSGQRGSVKFIRLGSQKVVPEAGWTFDAADSRLAGSPDIDPEHDSGLFLWRDADNVLTVTLIGDGGKVGAATGEFQGELTPAMVETSEPFPRKPPRRHRLYQNQDGRLVDVTRAAKLFDASSGRDADFFDADNDGDLDLYIVNGGLSFGNLPDVLYINQGDGTFLDGTEEAGLVDVKWGRGDSVVAFDPDLDGDLDLFVTNGHGPALGNHGPDRFWQNQIGLPERRVQLHLVGTASAGISAQGARILVRFGDQQLFLTRESTSGAFSTSVLPFHIGVGKARQATIEIVWPSGQREELSVKAGERLRQVQDSR